MARAPGNVLLTARQTGLDRDPVANVSLAVAVDKTQLTDRAVRVSRRQPDLVFAGIDAVPGR